MDRSGDQRRIEKKRQRVGGHDRTAHQVPRTPRGFPRSLTLDNPIAAAALRHQCQEGTVDARVFIKLLDCGDRNGQATKRERMPFIGKDGRPWDWEERQRDAAAQAPQTTLIQSFTLGDPVVRRRLQREWEDGTMHPAIRNWFIEHGWELLLKQTEQKPRMPYVGRHGLPWEYDVMREQEAEAIAAQKDEAEALARRAPVEAQKEPAAGDHEAEEPEELEVYREKGDPRMIATAAALSRAHPKQA